MSSAKLPLLSICIITYNHKNYIADCLDSVLSQQTDFEYEIVVGDDCSTDGTSQICEDYAAKYSDKITLFKRPENIGMLENFMQTMLACRGEYIAICEGDDFWTYPGKVQAQVSFLLTNPDYNLSFHDAAIISLQEVNKQIQKYSEQDFIDIDINRTDYTVYDLLKGTLCPTASVVIRKPTPLQFPDWYSSLPFGDMSLFVLVTGDAKLRYFNEVWSAYRIHPASVSTQAGMAKTYHLGKIRMCLRFYDTLSSKYQLLFPAIMKEYTKSVSDIYDLQKEDRDKLKSIMPAHYAIFVVKTFKRRFFKKLKW